MIITLQHEEIERALKGYVSSEGISLVGKNCDIKIVPGSQSDFIAELDVSLASTRKTVSSVPKSKTKAKGAAPAPEAVAELITLAKDIYAKEAAPEVEAKVEEDLAEEVPANSKSLFA